MSAIELIKQVAALSPRERTLFDQLFHAMKNVLITVEGKPKARLTRANMEPGNGASPKSTVDLSARVKELASLREKYRTGKAGSTADQILEETRADRP